MKPGALQNGFATELATGRSVVELTGADEWEISI